MYGELHIKPWELSRMTFREVALAIEGLKNKHLVFLSTVRRATLLIMSSFIGKKAVEAVKKGFPIEEIDGTKGDWIEQVKKAMKKADERTDKEKVKKVLDGRGA